MVVVVVPSDVAIKCRTKACCMLVMSGSTVVGSDRLTVKT